MEADNVAYFKLISQNFTKGTEKNYEYFSEDSQSLPKNQYWNLLNTKKC
jgi:hypothetical protein